MASIHTKPSVQEQSITTEVDCINIERSFNWEVGPTIDVYVLPYIQDIQMVVNHPTPELLANARKYRALLDTAGDMTRVSWELIQDLSLHPTDAQRIVNDAERYNVFMVNLAIISDVPPDRWFGLPGRRVIPFRKGSEVPYDVILGRTKCLSFASTTLTSSRKLIMSINVAEGERKLKEGG